MVDLRGKLDVHHAGHANCIVHSYTSGAVESHVHVLWSVDHVLFKEVNTSATFVVVTRHCADKFASVEPLIAETYRTD